MRNTNCLKIAILVLAFGLRLWQLNASSIWYDEAFTIHYASNGPLQAALELLRYDNVPPLYGVVLSVWMALLGRGEFVVRFLSVIIGTLAVAAIGRFASEIDRRAGWGAMLAASTLPISVFYSQEARYPVLAVCLSALFGITAWRLMTPSHAASKDLPIAFVVSGTTMMLAYTFTSFLWAVFLILALWQSLFRKDFPVKRWWLANLALAGMVFPLAIWALWRTRVDATALGRTGWDMFKSLPIEYGVGLYLREPWASVFLIVAAISLSSAIVLLRRNRPAVAFLVGGLVLPVLLLTLTSRISGKWSSRYLLPSWGVCLFVAIGVGWGLLPKIGRVALAVAWLVMTIPVVNMQAQGQILQITDPTRPRPDFRAVATYIAQHKQSGDAVLCIGGHSALALDYYLDDIPIAGLPDSPVLDLRQPFNLRLLESLPPEVNNASRIWLVLWQQTFVDPTASVENTLLDNCRRLNVAANFVNVNVLLFDMTSCRPIAALAAPAVKMDARFGNLELDGYAVRWRNDNTLIVDLWWEAVGPIPESYTTFVHLVRPGEPTPESLVAQDDRPPGAAIYPTTCWEPGTYVRQRHELHLPAGDPCQGCYLRIGLYTDGGRLRLANGDDAVVIELYR